MLSDAEWWEDRSGQCVEEFCRVVGRHNKRILSVYTRVLYEPLLRTHDLTRRKRGLPKIVNIQNIIADVNDLLLYAFILRVAAKKGFETATNLKDWVHKQGDEVLERVGLKVHARGSKPAWKYDSVFCGKDFTPGSEDFIKMFSFRTQQWKFSNMYVKEQNDTAIDLMVVNPAARVIITELRLQLKNTKLELETYRNDADIGTVPVASQRPTGTASEEPSSDGDDEATGSEVSYALGIVPEPEQSDAVALASDEAVYVGTASDDSELYSTIGIVSEKADEATASDDSEKADEADDDTGSEVSSSDGDDEATGSEVSYALGTVPDPEQSDDAA